jgi:hypothetical protein
LGVEREIKEYDNESKEILQEINVGMIPLERLLAIVEPKADDPLLYDGYILNEYQIEEFNSHFPHRIIANFETCYYVLECSGLYDYIKS